MVPILVLLLFALFIGISLWREKKAATAVAAMPAQETPEYYLHPSHSFARLATDGTVEVGMDEFSHRALGKVKVADLPSIGQQVRQGDKAWKLLLQGRSLIQRIPVDGQIIAANDLGDSWLLKIKPSRLGDNLANLIQGASVVQWLKSARAKILLDLSGQLVPAMQDGGELVEGFARNLDDRQWQEFCKEFFNCENCQ